MSDNNLNPVRNEISNGIKNKIMRRVYAIWFFKKIISPLMLEALVFMAIIISATFYVSFFNVMKNAFDSSSSVYSLSIFFLNAFVNAKIISQMLFLGLIAVALILGWELLFKKRDSQPFISPLL